jgi:hypothetical protein
MIDTQKPHKGSLKDWRKFVVGNGSYVICGTFRSKLAIADTR